MPPLDAIGDGWLRLMKFDTAAPVPMIDNRTDSTHYKKFSREIPDDAKWYRPHEQPNMSGDRFLAAEDFVIELKDFRERFDKAAKTRY